MTNYRIGPQRTQIGPQKIARLVDRLGSGPHLVGRIGSGVRISHTLMSTLLLTYLLSYLLRPFTIQRLLSDVYIRLLKISKQTRL